MSVENAGFSSIAPSKGSAAHERHPLWLGPLLALCTLSLGFAAIAWFVSGGREFADDADQLLRLSRHPFVLWQSYEESGLGPSWGSFPPLLPTLFGALVHPWTLIASDFWAIRLGALTWTSILLLGLSVVLQRLERPPRHDVRAALWLFAIIPSVWGAAGLIPEEEAYVAIFALALFWAGRVGAWRWVGPLLLLAALAGKYFLLILLIPLAFASPRPFRNLLVWGGLVVIGLGAYVAYHKLRFDLTPILAYGLLELYGNLSIWSLMFALGVPLESGTATRLGVLVTGGLVTAWAVFARRASVDLAFSATVALYITLLTISRSWPGYVLWVLPLALVCWTRVQQRSVRVALPALMLAWSAGEWGANLFRGVHLALTGERGAGKTAIAARVEGLLGSEFPYGDAYVACVALVVTSGIALIVLFVRAGLAGTTRPLSDTGLGVAPHPSGFGARRQS